MVRSKILPAWGTLLCAMVFLFGCAALEQRPQGPPLPDQEAVRIVRNLQEEGRQVSSFYSLGMVSAGEWYGESEADILVAGVREPFRIKVEITHTWGQPLLHILIDGTKVRALSFRENKFYQGTFTSRALSRVIPVRLEPDLIWGILRGYPNILPHEGVQSLGPNQISLLNGKRQKVEIIDLESGRAWPKRVTFPGRNIRVTYRDFHREGGVPYARNVKVSSIDGGERLTLNHRRMVLNGDIPDGVFTIPRPPAMEIIDLDRAGAEAPR